MSSCIILDILSIVQLFKEIFIRKAGILIR